MVPTTRLVVLVLAVVERELTEAHVDSFRFPVAFRRLRERHYDALLRDQQDEPEIGLRFN